MQQNKSHTLLCHPFNDQSGHYGLAVSVNRQTNGDLWLRYTLTGQLEHLIIPAPCAPVATDGLWQHTCFEAFIAIADASAYREFNFSPSGQWAAYAFSRTRERCAWSIPVTPNIELTRQSNSLCLTVVIEAKNLPPNSEQASLQLGLTAVLEAQSGECSYWALHHPAPHPDFHDRAGFTLTLSSF